LIAVDTSVIIPWLNGETYQQTQRLEELIESGEAALAAVSLTEILSDPQADRSLIDALAAFELLPVLDGYWVRAGLLRARVRAAGRKAALGDALIAQACLDSETPLLTRDADFKAFVRIAGLTLVSP
jgi:predicted nucleic acid-binding protein